MKPIKQRWLVGVCAIVFLFLIRALLITLLSSHTYLSFFSPDDLKPRANEKMWVGEQNEGGRGDAVATFVFSDSYVPPALVLVKSMEKISFSGDKVCLVTNKVTKRGVNKLREGGWKVLNIPLIENPLINVDEHEFPSVEEKQKGIATWTKLHLFSLTEYSRIIYIDSDAFFYTQPTSFSGLFDCLNKDKNDYGEGFTEFETTGERFVCGVHQKKTFSEPNSMTLNTGFLVFRPHEQLEKNMLERAKDLGGSDDDFTEQAFLQKYFFLLCSSSSSLPTTTPSSSSQYLSLPLYNPETKHVNKTTSRQWEGMEKKEKGEEREGLGGRVYSSSCAFLPDRWNHAQSFIFLGEKGREEEREKNTEEQSERENGGEGERKEDGGEPPFLVHFSGGLSKPWIWKNYFFGKYFDAWRNVDDGVLKESNLPGIEDEDFWLGVALLVPALVVLLVLMLESLEIIPSANVLPSSGVFAQRKSGSTFAGWTILFFTALLEVGVWVCVYRSLPSLMGFRLGWLVYLVSSIAIIHFVLFLVSFLGSFLPRFLPVIKPPASRPFGGYILSLCSHALFLYLLTQISGAIGPFKGNPYIQLKVLDLVLSGVSLFVLCVLPSSWWFHLMAESSC